MQYYNTPDLSCDINQSDDTEELPDDPEDLPDDTEELPDDPEDLPDDTEELPDDPEDLPDDTEELPDDPEDLQDDTVERPDDTEELWDDTDVQRNTYAIDYYPEKDYIPMESMYKNMNVSYHPHMRPSSPKVDVTYAKELWIFIIKIKNIDDKFFNDVHRIVMDNTTLPQNVISARYYNENDATKNLSFHRCGCGCGCWCRCTGERDVPAEARVE